MRRRSVIPRRLRPLHGLLAGVPIPRAAGAVAPGMLAASSVNTLRLSNRTDLLLSEMGASDCRVLSMPRATFAFLNVALAPWIRPPCHRPYAWLR